MCCIRVLISPVVSSGRYLTLTGVLAARLVVFSLFSQSPLGHVCLFKLGNEGCRVGNFVSSAFYAQRAFDSADQLSGRIEWKPERDLPLKKRGKRLLAR